MIGEGVEPHEAVKRGGATVEGWFATEAVHFLAQGSGIELPISEAMYRLLFEGEPLQQVVHELFARQGKPEFWDTGRTD